MEQNAIKENVGREAAAFLVKSGMRIGLGTGSTVVHAVRHIGLLMKEGKLKDILAVSTSFQTSIECEKLGIPIFTFNSREIGGTLDLTIDGADEVDPENRLIKGGGGALLMEKIAAYMSASFAVVVDESKLVENLGIKFPVPVEVIPEARVPVSMALEGLGAEVMLREALRKAGPVITEHGNLIFDIRFKDKVDVNALERELNQIPGVVENGFFTGPKATGNALSQSLRPLSPWRPEIFIGLADGKVQRRS
ncbi:MAG: ribose-5-phosphate isomerase RpiA [Treponema sp.]|nr:ribose-5-phosphate isomerase RpiA [Treponema sp.]